MKRIYIILFISPVSITSSAQNNIIVRGNSILANRHFETSYGIELGFEHYLNSLYGWNAEVSFQFPSMKFKYTEDFYNYFTAFSIGPVIKYQLLSFIHSTLALKFTYFGYSRDRPGNISGIDGIYFYEEEISNNIGAKVVGGFTFASMSLTFGYDFAPTEIRRRWFDTTLQKEFIEKRDIDMSKWVFSFGFKFTL